MRYAVLVLLCLSTAGAATPVAAQEGQLVEEVAGLRASVDELVNMLDRYMGYQKIELTLRRVDLKQRQLSPMERELRNHKDSLESTHEELEGLEMYTEQVEAEIEEELRTSGDIRESEEGRRIIKEIASRREILEERMAGLERSVMELENDVAVRQRELLDLEDLLADMLED